MTAAERLKQLSGAGDISAAARLRRIAGIAGAAGAILVAYSALPTATAAAHLLHDREAVEEVRPGFVYGSGGQDLEQQVRDGWELLELRRRGSASQDAAAAAAPPAVAPAQAPQVVKITAAQAERLQQLLPSATTDAERALLLALVLAEAQAAPGVTVTAGQGPAALTEDELALVTMLLAQRRLH